MFALANSFANHFGHSCATPFWIPRLLHEGEDIYQALGRVKNKLISEEACKAFWEESEANAMQHNRSYTAHVYLELLEKFYSKCGFKVDEGKFTETGCTVGECKLFASLHALKLVQDTIMSKYPGLSKFYERFSREPATEAITSGAKTGLKLAQYFF